MKISAIVSILVWLAALAVPPAAAQVGAVQQARVEDPGHAPIPVAIWSPAPGPVLGLIVISHGTGAGAISHVDTAQALAEAGFVVVAPMHPGDNFQDDSAVGKPQWFVDRARHIGKVIDFMLGGWEGKGRLDAKRIGIFGFSAGATTALISIGGTLDLARVPAHCAAAPEFICKLMAPPAADAGSPAWTHDRRVAAAVIAAPGLGFAFDPASLAGVKVPVQLWAGAADEIVPYETNAGAVRRALPAGAEFHSVPGAVHLSFLAPCGPQSPPFLCEDGPGFDRAAFHRDFNRSVAAFFRDRLAVR